ncbi:MAG: branched-chain amino acid ABC transporter permease [Thermodesulfobacteriota bacterium]|nr:branched-chain amino acid ABC transporter permease [Thermodesulfobacteriota bacterium]
MFLLFLQFLVNGLMVGGVYALIALGIVLIYKSTRVFNFAVGELVVLGGFACWSLIAWCHLPVYLSIPLAMVIAIGMGFLMERLALRPLIGQPILAAIMATLALSLLLRGIMLFFWGASTIAFPTQILPGEPVSVGHLAFSHELLWAFGVSMVVFIALTVFFRKTKMGLFMRATAESHQIAQATGINVRVIFGTTWGIAALVAALGGILVGARLGLGIGSTPLVAFKAFPAVIFGGLESVAGAIIGGLLVGILENLAGGFIDPKIAEITPYIILLLVLIFKPEGLFGLKRIERI